VKVAKRSAFVETFGVQEALSQYIASIEALVPTTSDDMFDWERDTTRSGKQAARAKARKIIEFLRSQAGVELPA